MECLFCSFANKEVGRHRGGYTFSMNYSTKNTISFLSIDSPVNNEAHIIVTPKKHFKEFHDIPSPIKTELIEHVSMIGKFYSSKSWGYNILLNNSRVAGQYVPHSHFHIIPRKKGDKIKIEIWERKKISPLAFRRLSERTRDEFRKFIC